MSEAVNTGEAARLLEQVEQAAPDQQWGVIRDVARDLLPVGDPTRPRVNQLCDAGGYESAALALVERAADEWTAIEIRSRRRRTAWVAELSRLADDDDEPLEGFSDEVFVTGHGKTPALALLAAALKALLTQSQEP